MKTRRSRRFWPGRLRLGGVTDNDAELLAEAFNILTVRQLGKNKYFAVAVALAVLENAG